ELERATAQAAKRVNILMKVAHLNDLSLTISNLKTGSGRIADLAAELQPTLKALPVITVRTDKALSRVDPLLVNLNNLTQEVRARVDTLDQIGRSADDLGQTS